MPALAARIRGVARATARQNKKEILSRPHARRSPASEPGKSDGGRASDGRNCGRADDFAGSRPRRYFRWRRIVGGKVCEPAHFRRRGGEDEPVAAVSET